MRTADRFRKIDPRRRQLPAPTWRIALGLLALLSLWPSTARTEDALFSEESKQALRNRTAPLDRPYLLDVGSRLIAPSLTESIPLDKGRPQVYVQFQRPLTAEERATLTRTGVRFYEALPPYTYLAKIKPEAMAGLRKHSLIRGISNVAWQDKVTASLFRGAPPSHAVSADGRWKVFVRFYPDVDLTQALRTVDGLSIAVTDRRRMLFGNRLQVQTGRGQLYDLARNPLVRSIYEVPPPPREDNATAAAISNVDDIQIAPYNLDGSGVAIGEWDGGQVRDTHQDLAPRVTIRENANPISSHSTHVCGTMISSGANNALAMGMAPAAGQVFSYDFNGDPVSEQDDSVTNDGIRLSNHSWGPVLGWNFDGTSWSQTGNQGDFGSYEGNSVDWDDLVRSTGLVVMKSSGNDRNDCNPNPPFDCDGTTGGDGVQYDTVGQQGNAKNIITVGAINDDGTTITAFSSTGPADDGRIKPDVVANGQGLLSTCGTSDADYCSMSGTSMSTPTVSGIVADLIQRYRQVYSGSDPGADIVKALLVDTATDLGRPGPDYIYGHGLVNALAAVQIIDAGPVRILTGAVDQGDVDEYLLEVRAGMTSLDLTLNWIDPSGSSDSSDPDLVNNLDLEVVDPANGAHYPFTGPGNAYSANATATGANNLDNVEHTRVASPAQGFWLVRVRGTSVPGGPQGYALVANASFNLPDQPSIKVAAALDFNEVCPGDMEERAVSIFNDGGADLLVQSVSVVAGGADFSVLPNPTQPFIVQPGAHVDVTVRFEPSSPAPPSLRTGTLRIVSNDPDEGTLDFPMTGQVGSPDIRVTGDATFGDVCPEDNATRTISICNVGTCDLSVTSVAFEPPCDDFVLVNSPFPAPVSPDSCESVVIRFTPTSAGPKACTLVVRSDDPDAPVFHVPVTASTPSAEIDVPDDLAFPATVLQSVGACWSPEPFPVSNLGTCNLSITGFWISANPAEYSLAGLPSFPIVLEPGHIAGEGDLAAVFGPQILDRARLGEVTVTYESDPITHDTASVTRTLCGEGVRTGARVLVTQGGAPMEQVEQIKLVRINANRNRNLLDTVDNARNLSLQNVILDPPCMSFAYHREYGTVSNPIQLLPGSYQVTATAIVNRRRTSKSVGFEVGTCGFNSNILIGF